MGAKLLDGKAASDSLLAEVKAEISRMATKPLLAIVSIGDDPASQIYMKRKLAACEKVGMKGELLALSAKTTQEEALRELAKLRARPDVSGIIVQVPVPAHLDPFALQGAIPSSKDADGYGIENLGKLLAGAPGIRPATPAGIMRLLSHYSIPVAGKHAVVVGRSSTVGKPAAQLLLLENATVTMAHSKTANLGEITRQADILVVAVGKPNLITANMVKKGAVVIDVGMNRLPEKKGGKVEKLPDDPSSAGGAKPQPALVGDVDFAGVSAVASYITPVPGGVGPMTVASLISNTLACHKSQRQ